MGNPRPVRHHDPLFDRKIYGPKDFGENTVFGLRFSVIQFFGRNIPILRVSDSHVGSFLRTESWPDYGSS